MSSIFFSSRKVQSTEVTDDETRKERGNEPARGNRVQREIGHEEQNDQRRCLQVTCVMRSSRLRHEPT